MAPFQKLKLVLPNAERTPSDPQDRIYKGIRLAAAEADDRQGEQNNQDQPGLDELQLLLDLHKPSTDFSVVEDVVEALERAPARDDEETDSEEDEILPESDEDSDSTDTEQDNTGKKPSSRKKPAQKKSSGRTTGGQLDNSAPPRSDIYTIFNHLTNAAVERGLLEALDDVGDQGLRMLTMCSGSEAPFVGLDLVQNSLRFAGHQGKLKYKHLGSAEIEPWKQAFILRNFHPPVIYRDVTDFSAHAAYPDDEKYLPVTAHGKRVQPPKNAHILVAGSSCVDFSSLNTKKISNLEEGTASGESAQTLKGIADYCEMYTPTIIIVENVRDAPWTQMTTFWGEKGYAAVPVQVDTINFYLPQTRQRGYLFGVHKETAKLVGFDINAAHTQWISLMNQFQQRASSPYSSFMLDDDDQRLRALKSEFDRTKKKGNAADWSKCRTRHVHARSNLKLGNGTPYTQRRGNIQANLEDHADQAWALSQSMRVLDFLDIAQLINVNRRDYDTRFKHRNLDISQNVDRDIDKRQWGIVGCVTPSGCLFETRRARPFTGLELLALQGFPTDSLRMERYKSSQLQNLAGNAMSTTVIGAAILSALIACFNVRRDQGTSSIFESVSQRVRDGHDLIDAQQPGQSDTAQFETDIDSSDLFEDNLVCIPEVDNTSGLGHLIQHAHDLQPLCRCEGLHHRTEYRLLYCPNCYYTCCEACSRDKHGQDELKQLMGVEPSRPNASTFVDRVMQELPPVLVNECPSLEAMSSNGAWDETTKDRIKATLNSTVHFQSVKYEGAWRVIYESLEARLELEFTPNRYVCSPCAKHDKPTLHLEVKPMWLLFVKASATEAVKSGKQPLFRQPIARMQPTDNLFRGEWEFCARPVKNALIHMTGAGEQVPSWERNMGLEDTPFLKLNAFSQIQFDSIHGSGIDNRPELVDACGTYNLFQGCPTPSGTLHRNVGSTSSDKAPIFMFLQSDPLGPGYSDHVVLSTQPFERNMVDNRYVLARIRTPWRPVATKKLANGTDVKCDLVGLWNTCSAQRLSVSAINSVLHSWIADPSKDLVSGLSCANGLFSILILDMSHDPRAKVKLGGSDEIFFNLERQVDALSSFGWISSRVSQIPHLSSGLQTLPAAKGTNCETCSPLPPKLRWMLHRRGQRDVVKALECPLGAAKFENALINRAQPAVAILRKHGGKILLDIKLNVMTLVHRAASSLLRSVSHGSIDLLEWRVTAYNRFSPRPEFQIPALLSNKDDDILPELLDLVLERNPNTRNTGDQAAQPELWDPQLKALTWMYNQETSPKPWDELSLEESCLPSINWRMEAQARTHRNDIRGGVLADDVGAGKTITSLALAKFDYEQREMFRNLANTTEESEGTVEEPQPGRLSSDATLILVPKNILGQWEKEIQKCLPWTQLDWRRRQTVTAPYYVVIKNATDLQRYSHTEIQAATLILAPWDIFAEKAYWELLRKTASFPCVPPNPSRAFQEWLDLTLRSLGRCVEGLKQNVRGFWTAWDDVKRDTEIEEEYERFEGFLSRGSKKAANKAGPTTGKITRAKTSGKTDLDQFRPNLKASNTKFDQPPVLLHMFRFRRLMVDEFTYVQGETLLALLQLKPWSTWLLSGTPPIYNYDDMNTMAKLLGTQITTYDEEEGKFGFGRDANSMTKDKSNGQEILSYHNFVSSEYKTALITHAVLFAILFIRKNASFGERKMQNARIVNVPMTPIEWIAFIVVDEIAENPDLTYNKRAAVKGKEGLNSLSFLERLEKQVEKTTGPREARICAAIMLIEVLKEVEFKLQPNTNFLQQLKAFETERLECVINDQKDVVRDRADVLLGMLQELHYMMDTIPAKPTGCEASFASLVKDTKLHKLADGDSVAIMDRLLKYAKEHPLRPGNFVSSSGRDSKWVMSAMANKAHATREFSQRVADVNTQLESLMGDLRRARLFGAALAVLLGEESLACSVCGTAVDAETASLATFCGHLLCKAHEAGACCLSRVDNEAYPASCFDFSYLCPGVSGEATESRVRQAVALVERATECNDSVVVFAQFKALKDAFVVACRAAGIPCSDGFADGTAARAVEAFRQQQTPGCLVLKVDSADAAGWNLQCASHVVFLATPVAEEKERAAIMEQAVGRCWRPGQGKDVKISLLVAGSDELALVR